MKSEALQLANDLGISEEHPDFPDADWRAAVAAHETREGYWEWVYSTMRYQNHEWIELFDKDRA